MAETGGHYFVFSTNWTSNGQRRCGECDLPYDQGEHVEITTLKPGTKYVCPSGGGYGHSSIYTGAYLPGNRGLRDHLCICGQPFVEEDTETWRLSWEMQTPFSSGVWISKSVVRSKHQAQAQRDGLLELMRQGDPIRSVELVQLVKAGGSRG